MRVCRGHRHRAPRGAFLLRAGCSVAVCSPARQWIAALLSLLSLVGVRPPPSMAGTDLGPWLAGEGDGGRMNGLLWEGFTYSWPMMQTPQEAVGGAAAQPIANNGSFTSPQTSMAFSEVSAWYLWLPLWNTIILLSSSLTCHIAHMGILDGNKKKFNLWLGITVLLGMIFLFVQFYEYYEAYAHFGLTLNAGIYGSTFFMLTGFHGFHVTMGTIMLAIILIRCIKGHFTPQHHFGFEAVAWYWHFVDVVWLGLFIFVYWL